MAITTADELLRAGDIGRCELVRGELRRMIPAGDEHGRVVIRATAAVANHVFPRKLGVLHGAETGFILARDPDTVRAPDLAFTRAERAAPPVRGFVPGAEWLEAGTLAVWVVDPRTRTVTVHEPALPPETFGEADVVSGGELLPGLALSVGDLFV